MFLDFNLLCATTIIIPTLTPALVSDLRMGSKNAKPELRDEDVAALCEASGLGEEQVD